MINYCAWMMDEEHAIDRLNESWVNLGHNWGVVVLNKKTRPVFSLREMISHGQKESMIQTLTQKTVSEFWTWLKGFTESNTDPLNQREDTLCHDSNESLIQTLIHWTRAKQILIRTKMIHWLKHWSAERERSKCQSWGNRFTVQTLTRWFTDLSSTDLWKREKQICHDWKDSLIQTQICCTGEEDLVVMR